MNLKEISARINTALQDYDSLQDFAGYHGQFWELAPENARPPFITYRINENIRATKDRTGDYSFSVWSWAKNINQAADLDALVQQALEGATDNYHPSRANSGYVDDDVRSAYIERIFNVKIR